MSESPQYQDYVTFISYGPVNHHYSMSVISDPNDWSVAEPPATSPFNMEEILAACPALYLEWRERPFILDVDENGLRVRRWLGEGFEP